MRARVSRNTPTARPQNAVLQQYLREMVRILAATEGVDINDRQRVIVWFMNEPLEDFDYRPPDTLVPMGKGQLVIDYIDAIAGAVTG